MRRCSGRAGVSPHRRCCEPWLSALCPPSVESPTRLSAVKCVNTATWLQGLPYSPFTTGGPWHWVPCSYSGTAPREAPLTFLTPLQVGGPCGGRENGSHGTQALSVPQQRAPRTMGVQCCSLTIRLPAIRLRTGPSSNGNSLWGRQQLIRLTGARRSPVSPFPWCGPRLPSLKSEGRRDPAVG